MLDVVVIGAGFGGLGAALQLAEGGARVVVCETLRYPGGCASTFTRGGRAYEAGATLIAGLGEDGPFRRVLARHGVSLETEDLEPVIELRAGALRLLVPPSRAAFVERLCALPGAPQRAIRAFFATQARVADALWTLFDDPKLLPPLGATAVLTHLRRSPRYAAVVPLVGRTLLDVAAEAGRFVPLRTWLDATCQITVQTTAAHAEATFALAAIDYAFRGALHLCGGVGQLAAAMVRAIEDAGGEVRFANRVQRVERNGRAFRVHTRRGILDARAVVADLVPQALRTVTGIALPRLEERVESGWGACMLYLALRARPRGPRHLQLWRDPAAPPEAGNHVFCSIGESTATVSTHVRIPSDVRAVQARMMDTVEALAPELWDARESLMTASPRTFERFTGRPRGYVGGVPRRAGLRAYADLLRPRLPRGLHLVGDSVFPGQSALATTLGGFATARRVLGEL